MAEHRLGSVRMTDAKRVSNDLKALDTQIVRVERELATLEIGKVRREELSKYRSVLLKMRAEILKGHGKSKQRAPPKGFQY